ncbi:hypothetical protein [Serratia fonticola]
MITTIFATLTFDLFFLSPLSSFIKYEALHGRGGGADVFLDYFIVWSRVVVGTFSD